MEHHQIHYGSQFNAVDTGVQQKNEKRLSAFGVRAKREIPLDAAAVPDTIRKNDREMRICFDR